MPITPRPDPDRTALGPEPSPAQGPGRRPAAQGPERSAGRDAFHLVVLLVPWALFVWLWSRVLATTSGAQLINAAGLVLLVAAICVPATFLWVLHNVRIFRRKGARTGAAASSFDYHADWTSRPVVADWDAVRAARIVAVDIAPHRKRFLPDEVTELDRLLTEDLGDGAAVASRREGPPPEPSPASEADDPREPAAAWTAR